MKLTDLQLSLGIMYSTIFLSLWFTDCKSQDTSRKPLKGVSLNKEDVRPSSSPNRQQVLQDIDSLQELLGLKGIHNSDLKVIGVDFVLYFPLNDDDIQVVQVARHELGNGGKVVSILCYPEKCIGIIPEECAILANYITKSGEWLMVSIAPFFPETQAVDLNNDHKMELWESFMDCELGRCKWYEQLDVLGSNMLYEVVYQMESFSDVMYLQHLVRERQEGMSFEEVSGYQPGDTIENYIALNFEDLNNDGMKEIVKHESIQIFKGIKIDTLITEKLHRTNTYNLLESGLHIIKKESFKKSLEYYFDE